MFSRRVIAARVGFTISLILISAHLVAAQQIFVTSDTNINTNVSGKDIFVGKDNLNDFNTLPGTLTLTVADGANIGGVGTDADGQPYFGLNVFGMHRTNITGGSIIEVNSRDMSTVNISGGVVGNEAYGRDSSTINISGGNVNSADGFDSSTINIVDGIVNHVAGFNTTTINISGGTVKNRVVGNSLSTINISGGGVNYIQGTGDSVFNITGGDFDISGQPGVTLGGYVFRILDNSVVNVYGTNLSFTPTGAGSDLTGSYMGYLLSGTLANGQSISGLHCLDYDGGRLFGDPSLGANNPGNVRFFNGPASPEPSSLALVGLAVLPMIGACVRRKVSVKSS